MTTPTTKKVNQLTLLGDLQAGDVVVGERTSGTTVRLTYTGSSGGGAVDSVTFNSTSGIIGTTTNDAAAALSVGEYVTAATTYASPVSLSNNTAANITSISLTAGDWIVYGSGGIQNSGTNTSMITAVNTTSATLPTGIEDRAQFSFPGAGVNIVSLPVFVRRMSLSGTTTVYLVGYSSFTTGASISWGTLSATRVR